MTFIFGLAINIHGVLTQPLNVGCGLAINNRWFMTAHKMTFVCELTINNHCVMVESLKDI